jgi:hypothetical protein
LTGARRCAGIADALAKLTEIGALAADGEATIDVPIISLPDGRSVGSVGVGASHGEKGGRIQMPAAAEAMARDTLGTPIRLRIERLDGATTDADGNVQLLDGTSIHAVELVPVHLTQTLSKEQEVILHLALRFLRDAKPDLATAVGECYRPVDEGVLPGWAALDYAAIARLGQQRLPMLKAIERYVTDRMPHVSRQTIANALALAGLRRPRSGRRARPAASRRGAATSAPQSD